MLLIDNSKYTTQYFSIIKEKFVDLNSKISKKLFSPESYTAHAKNEAIKPTHLNDYEPVLPGIYPIPPRTKWEYDGENFTKLKKNIKAVNQISYESVLNNSNRVLKVGKGKIAVEISGGLDSSLIIGALEKLGYEPLLIGTKSLLYKFRTERHIQEIIAKKYNNVIWTNSFTRQFTNLLKTPAHFLPTFASLQHGIDTNTISILIEHNVKYLLHGTAFDCMLVEEMKGDPNKLDWPTLQDNWAHDYIYAPNEVSYIDVGALTPFWQMFSSLRNGADYDEQKWWARRYFAELIPPELSQYAYKANFGAQWWDGLKSSTHEIMHIVETAWHVTSLPIFKNFSMETIFDCIDQNKGGSGFDLLSYANWIHALHKAGRIID